MPVRIVKDDADESVLSDYFNFDNPQDANSSDSQDNSWNDGGGSRNNANVGGSLLSFLGSIAIDACVSYAYNAFMGSGKAKQGGFQNQNQKRVNHEDAEALLNERLESAELCVSLWAHIALSDNNMQQAEREAIDQLIRDTVGKLFPHDIADQTEASSILQKRLKSPHSYQTIVSQASRDAQFATQLYEQACLLAASDYAVEDNENIFLANLAKDLHINTDDVARIRSRYNAI